MIARTLFFSLLGHLGVNLSQLVYTPAHETGAEPRTFPIEDLGFIVIETPQMTVTAYALQALAENNTAVIFCDKTHTPASQLLPFAGHTLTQKHFAAQVTASEALKGRLWKDHSGENTESGRLFRGRRERGLTLAAKSGPEGEER